MGWCSLRMALDARVLILLLLLAVLPAHAGLQRWAVLGSVTGEEAALCDLVSPISPESPAWRWWTARP